MMTWTQMKFVAGIAAVALLAGTAGTVVLSQLNSTGSGQAPASVETTSALASGPSLEANFPDIVGTRLRKVVNVPLDTKRGASQQSIYEQSFLTIAWSNCT